VFQTPDPGANACTKQALEALLRQRKLHKDAPPLRGEDRRLHPLRTGSPAIDELLAGGFPRGQLSELQGPASSGRTGVALAILARLTCRGSLAAYVDPLDRLDPASAAASGIDLARLLWLRGPRGTSEEPPAKAFAAASAATATLAGSGLFELVVLDVAGARGALRSLPAITWLRLQKLVEGTPTALLLIGDGPIACGPGGLSLALEPQPPLWSDPPGPARLLRALRTNARVGRHRSRTAAIALAAVA
jgi:hypothetical protein